MPKSFILILLVLAGLSAPVRGQIEDICGDVGLNPSLDSPFAHVPYVYGRVTLKAIDPSGKYPNVTVIFSEGQNTPNRYSVGKAGNYCFRRSGGTASITVEVNGIEAARRTLTDFGGAQQREDFEIDSSSSQKTSSPGAISLKFVREPNPRTSELYKRVADAERSKKPDDQIRYLKQIVALDETDYIAWAKLGNAYFSQKSFTEADAAYRKSLELRVDYTPAWISAGQLRLAQQQFDAAAEIFKYASTLEPTAAIIYRLMGESYLQARKGTLGADALHKAIELDPIGMAECHLELAHLYELAGANKLATHEYTEFLKKVPAHPDKKKFEAFIKANPED